MSCWVHWWFRGCFGRFLTVWVVSRRVRWFPGGFGSFAAVLVPVLCYWAPQSGSASSPRPRTLDPHPQGMLWQKLLCYTRLAASLRPNTTLVLVDATDTVFNANLGTPDAPPLVPPVGRKVQRRQGSRNGPAVRYLPPLREVPTPTVFQRDT